MIILASAFFSVPVTADAFNDDYQCTAESETSVGYDPRSNVEAEAGKVKKPYTVRLSGILRNTSVLHAQQAVPLVKLMEAGRVI